MNLSIRFFLVICLLMLQLPGCGGAGGDGGSSSAHCSAADNPSLPDLDADGVLNRCDSDDENDGIDDKNDNCPYVMNSDQQDDNADGIGDACDGDGDGIEDRVDNCPQISNADQLDDDANGVGDICDVVVADDVFSFFSPINLSTSSGHTYRPATAIGTDGKVHVVWHDNTDEEAGMEVWYSTVDLEGLVHGPHINLSNNPAISVNPHIGVSSNGHIHVVYQDNITGNSDIFYTRSVDGGATFSTPKNISLIQESSIYPDIAIDAAGTLYVTWSGLYSVYVISSLDDGEHFGEPSSFPLTTPVEPTIAAGAAGEVHVAWAQRTNPAEQISNLEYAVSRDAGQTFGAVQVINSSNEIILRPNLDVDDQDVYAVWDQEVGGNSEIMVAISRNGGVVFSLPHNISNNDAVSIMSVVKVAPNGDVYLAWQDTSAGNYETVFSYSKDAGETFTAPLNFAPSAEGSLVVDMAVDAKNNAVIVWDDNRFDNFEAVLSYGNFGVPLIKDHTVIPEFFNPNADAIAFVAAFSEGLKWEVKVTDEDGHIVQLYRGTGNGLNKIWDGNDLDGNTVVSGSYYYQITGITQADARMATSVSGEIQVSSLDQEGTPPSIDSFVTDQIVFSPNNDGRDEESTISASFNLTVNWTMDFFNPAGELVFSEQGQGHAAEYVWKGLDVDGNSLPEGIYSVVLTASLETGESVSQTLEIEIDLTGVLVSEPVIGVVDLSEGTPANISFTISEGAVVTIYIYEATAVALVKELIRQSYHGGEQQVSVAWNGQSGGGSFVSPGEYQVNIWVRDYGANKYIEYPMVRTITVQP